MLRTLAILATLTSAVVAHWGHGWDQTYAAGYGGPAYADWNGHGVVTDVASRNYHSNGPWFTGNGVLRGANWNHGYGYTGWNRYSPWYGPSATTVAAANDVVYDTYAPTYANSWYGIGSHGVGGYASRYPRTNYDHETTAWPYAYSRYL